MYVCLDELRYIKEIISFNRLEIYKYAYINTYLSTYMHANGVIKLLIFISFNSLTRFLFYFVTFLYRIK